jgi:hypothetical protein
MIREAQQRGDFDNLPGTGKPIVLDENVFAGDMDAAYRVAANANAAPLWVTLDKEVSEDLEALSSLLERTALYMEEKAAPVTRPASSGEETGAESAGASTSGSSQAASKATGLPKPRWWQFGRRRAASRSAVSAASATLTLAGLEAERQRARTLYLNRAAEVDKKIEQYNSLRPRHLSWLEKQRLAPHIAARRFDARLPAFESATK